MSYTFIVLALIVAILLILIVLVQNSKGGGLASNFTGSTQIMGHRQTTDFLEKATWTLAGVLLVLSILSTVTMDKGAASVQESLVKDQVENAASQQALPAAPAQGAPAGEQAAQPAQPAQGEAQPAGK